MSARAWFVSITCTSIATLAGISPAFAQTQYSIGNPTNEQQYMLELTNRARAHGGAEATRLQGFTPFGGSPFSGGLQEGPPTVNGQVWTIQNSVQPLSWNPLLAMAAQNHANRLNTDDQFFSGQSPTPGVGRHRRAALPPPVIRRRPTTDRPTTAGSRARKTLRSPFLPGAARTAAPS